MLAPRGLAFALSLGALIALAAAASGSGLTLAVALYVSVPPLVGLAVVVASAWRDPTLPEVARVLDRDLALDERLGTAVEISGAGRPVGGLEALVLAEASAALATSQLSGARPTHRSARREWLVIAGALVIVSGLLVLTAGRGESLALRRLAAVTPAHHPAGRTSLAHGGGAKHVHRIGGRTGNVGPAGRRGTTPSLKAASKTSALSVVAQRRRATTAGRFAPGLGGKQRTPAGAPSRLGSQTAGLGARAGTPGARAGARGAGGGAARRAGSRSSAAASMHPGRASHSGRVRLISGPADRSHGAKPQRAGAGSRAGTSDYNRASGSHGSVRAPAGASGQVHATGAVRTPSARSAAHRIRSPSGHGRSVGNDAGTSAGGNPLGQRQTKGLPSAFTGRRLPIQAGYAAARNKSGPKRGNPAGSPGGKGRARSATENHGGVATAVMLPYIPPSADIGPVDHALLQHYFSSAAKVAGRW